MSFLEFPIRRYQFTLIAFAMLVALGVTSYKNIPRQEDPYFPISVFQIVAVYPGAEPQDVERLVVKPIEDRLSELDDIKNIESFSNLSRLVSESSSRRVSSVAALVKSFSMSPSKAAARVSASAASLRSRSSKGPGSRPCRVTASS